MFFTADHEQLRTLPQLRRSMFADRAAQFVTRHQWPLAIDQTGLEIDDYDDELTTYCLIAKEDRHIASLRLRFGGTDSMAERHFPELWQAAARGDRQGDVEITRLCVSPGLTADERITALSDLLLGLCRHGQREKLSSFFGVVFPAVARVIQLAGWPARTLARTTHAKGTLVLAEWTPSNLVAWSIQEHRELREEIRGRRRNDAAEPERLVA